MAQSTGLYLARSLRTLVGLDMADTTPHTHWYTQTLSMILLPAQLFNSEKLALLTACPHLQYIGHVYRG